MTSANLRRGRRNRLVRIFPDQVVYDYAQKTYPERSIQALVKIQNYLHKTNCN